MYEEGSSLIESIINIALISSLSILTLMQLSELKQTSSFKTQCSSLERFLEELPFSNLSGVLEAWVEGDSLKTSTGRTWQVEKKLGLSLRPERLRFHPNGVHQPARITLQSREGRECSWSLSLYGKLQRK